VATLVEAATSDRRLLEAEHFVGRGSSCALCISHRYVSAQHAVLRWSGDHWTVKDLGSRNGTFVDGVRLRAGEELPLRVGSRLAFGKRDDEWRLDDAGAPASMAVLEQR
jgi:pSer/pThr/pTyr-binding forkhead associated (FHA) protein